MKRYGLSGIYIFNQFPDEEKKQPTCVEDCSYETRQEWFDTLDREALLRTLHHLCDTLHNFAENLESEGVISFDCETSDE